MKPRRTIAQDQKRCIGCRACELHCKCIHDLPPGPRLCEIVQVGPSPDAAGVPRVKFMFMPCFHCEDAACITACPTGAMRREESTGIVYVESSRCVGCKNCIIACSWGVPQWDDRNGTVMKCDYCRDRLSAGLEPACVTGCTTRALSWTTPRELSQKKRAAAAVRLADASRED